MTALGWTESDVARNFIAGVHIGVNSWNDIESYDGLYGRVTGFVYFIAIGHPYISHVKIGYTAKNPLVRMASLQTGCPFKMEMLGFVLGNISYEQELHGVLHDDRCEGEWFVYSDYVSRVIGHQLTSEAV